MFDDETLEPRLVGVIESVVGGGEPCANSGEFRFSFTEGSWEWSEDLVRMLGYEPGEVEASTELLLSHEHPDDMAAGVTLTRVVEPGEAFCSRHRIVDVAGQVHEVIVVADYETDEAGAIVATKGFFVDLNDALEQERNEALTDALPEVIASRAPIEQAKGILMLVYGLAPEQAFGLLRWRSQNTNTKLRELAAQVVRDASNLDSNGAGLRTRFDHVLLTAHERIDGVGAAQ